MVQQPRLGADLEHGLGHLAERLDRAQPTEDAAGPEAVPDGLVDPVSPRDLHVQGVRLHAADLEDREHDVDAPQGCAEVRRDLDPRRQPGVLDEAATNPSVRSAATRSMS